MKRRSTTAARVNSKGSKPIVIEKKPSSQSLKETGSSKNILRKVESDDVQKVVVGQELDKVLADERSPPTIEDHMRTLFRSAILDHLIVSWETKPCMQNVYGFPPPAESVNTSSSGSTLDKSSIEIFTSDARSSQQMMHAKRKKRSKKSLETSLTTVPVPSSLERRQTFPLSSKHDKVKDVAMGESIKQSKQSLTTKVLLPSASSKGDSLQIRPEIATSKDGLASLSNDGSAQTSDDWVPQPFPDEMVNVTFVNGNQYVGRVSRKLMDGEGLYILNNGCSYKGHFKNGEMTGHGDFQWADLNRYIGEMSCGWRHGRGSFIFFEVDTAYNGDWYWGLKHGQGIVLYNWNRNDWYWGTWKNDHYDGFGKRFYPNGAFYIGYWRLGKRHGIGSQIWPNSDMYRGNWQFGVMNGYGEYVWSLRICSGFSMNPGTFFRGHFRNGLRDGTGQLYVSNCSSMQANWVEDLRQGAASICAGNGVLTHGDPFFIDDNALPIEDPPVEECINRLLNEKEPSEVFRIQRKGTKPFCRSTIEILDYPEVLPEDFSKLANEIPLRIPDHKIDLKYHVERLRKHKYFKVAHQVQTEDISSVLPFIDMAPYFSDGEDEETAPPNPPQKSNCSTVRKEPTDTVKSAIEILEKLKTQGKWAEKPRKRNTAQTETNLLYYAENSDARNMELPPLSPPSAIPKEITKKVSHSDVLGDVIASEFGTQTPVVWYPVIEEKAVEEVTVPPGKKMRRKISGHNSGPTQVLQPQVPYKLPSFDGLCEAEFEVKWIRRVIERHLTNLRAIYDKYTNLLSKEECRFKPLMPRMILHLLYRDCGFHIRDLSMWQIDIMLAARPDSGVESPHCPMERVYFWQFLHSLLDISWVLYARHGIHGSLARGTLAGALDKLIVEVIIPNTGLPIKRIQESVFLTNKDLVPLDDAFSAYKTQSSPYTARDFLNNVFPKDLHKHIPEMCSIPLEMFEGSNRFSLGDIPIFIPGKTPLLEGSICHLTARLASLARIGPKKIVKILAFECPPIMSDGIIVNMDYPLSFLEWYEVVIMCAKAGLKKERDFYKRQLAKEEHRLELAAIAAQEERVRLGSIVSGSSVGKTKKVPSSKPKTKIRN